MNNDDRFDPDTILLCRFLTTLTVCISLAGLGGCWISSHYKAEAIKHGWELRVDPGGNWDAEEP